MKIVTHDTETNNSILMAKGRFRGSTGSNKNQFPNGVFKGAEIFTTEFEINETPPSARTLLTKGYIQDEINNFSGATVSTRGRFMTEQEKSRCTNERSLYLYIQGHTKHNIDLAMHKINGIIKTEHQSSLNRPSRFTNAPPPLMSLHTGVSSVEKICVGIENAPQGFDLRGRMIGTGGANLLYIRGETGATVTLRGRGSQFIDATLGTESLEPLHLYIEHLKPEALQNAKQLAINLIQTIQSELQSYIQQQPPPIQQQVLETSQISHIQQAHFQTMNIGTLTQSNVVTIQHQDIIQHPQSSVVTLPATILTATMTGRPSPAPTAPPPGLHIPAHPGSLPPRNQSQEMQTFITPPSTVGQVELIGPPPTMSQVQYQIHPGQPVHIQGIQMPTVSHSSTQPVAQMYVMNQPPPQSLNQQGYIGSTGTAVTGAVSYVYTQPSIQRSPPPPPASIESVNVNLQQPPPSASLNVTHQPSPSLLHLHFPPPNFLPNQPPPPIPQTYQIQYQQMSPSGPPPSTQFVLQSDDSIVQPHLQHNSDHAPHVIPAQQYPLQVPPPAAQTFLVTNSQTNLHEQPPLPVAVDVSHQHENPVDHVPLPQPVPPPQIVPPPSVVNQMSNSLNILTNMPPPNQRPPPQRHIQNLPAYQCGPPPTQRHGNGEGERQQQLMHGQSVGGIGHPHGNRIKLPLTPSHPGENRHLDQRSAVSNSGNELNTSSDCGPMVTSVQSISSSGSNWQPHHERVPWSRPPPLREGEYHSLYQTSQLPTNMPSSHIRSRGQPSVDRSRSPVHGVILDNYMNVEYDQLLPYAVKPPPYNFSSVVQSIYNQPLPPLPTPSLLSLSSLKHQKRSLYLQAPPSQE